MQTYSQRISNVWLTKCDIQISNKWRETKQEEHSTDQISWEIWSDPLWIAMEIRNWKKSIASTISLAIVLKRS